MLIKINLKNKEMKVKSTKPKKQRILKCSKFRFGKNNVKTRRPFWIEPIDTDMFFCLKKGEWLNIYDDSVFIGSFSSSYYSMTRDGYNDIYSLKAAKRKIAKWNVPKGTKFLVSLPFVGYDFTITKS